MIVPKEICDGLSDREIVKKSLEEVDFFSCLYERYEKRLTLYIRRIAPSAEADVEDILQEAFIKIWKNLHTFDQDLKFSSWIYRIVHNHTISRLRKRNSFGKDKWLGWSEKLSSFIPGTSMSNEDENETESGEFTQDILDRLPVRYREVLVLRFFESMSYLEISDVLKIPEGTVATRINRAKKAFARQYAKRKKIVDL